jgi:hypothetical protein
MNDNICKLSSNVAKLALSFGFAALLWGGVSSARADYSNTVISLGPLVYYRLNQTIQPPAADIATNSGTAGARGNAYYYNAAAINSTQNPQHGVKGALAGSSDTAALFDGMANYVMLALPDETNSLNPQGAFSAEAWFNVTGAGVSCPLSFADVNGLNGNADGWGIYEAGSKWNLIMFDGNGTNPAVNIAGGAVSGGSWSHVVAVYDGTNAFLYVNGQLAAQAPATGYVPNKSGQFVMGARSDESEFFPGSMDEVALYTNVLSASDVLAHYSNGTNTAPSPSYNTLVQANNPLLYYRLDEPAFAGDTNYPVAANLGTLGTAANGSYVPGSTPGVAGPPFAGLGPNPLACKFNGASGYVQMGDIVTLLGGSIPSTLTVSAWVKLADLQQNRPNDYIVGAGDDSFRLQRNNTGDHGTLQWACNGLHVSSYGGLIPLDDGQWHHLVAIVSPAGISNFVDGNLDLYRPEVPSSESSETLSTSTVLTSIGECIQDPGRVWNGFISEVAIFGTALSAAQVQQLYDASEASPQITQQPVAPDPVYTGSTVSLNVTAVGVQPLSYQWTANGAALAGETNASLVFTNVSVTEPVPSYHVIVTNAYGSVTSSVAVLNPITTGPGFVQQPASITRWVGGAPDLFSVVANGSEPISYQWLKGTNPIPGATNANFALSGPLLASDAGTYSVMVKNGDGGDTSDSVVLTVATPPNNYAAQVMALRPYAYWPLNETNGAIAYDYASGLNGTNAGAIILGAPGNSAPGFGTAHPVYNFNNAGGVNLGSGIKLDDTKFTILAWIQDNNSPIDQGGIFTKANAADNGNHDGLRLATFGVHYLEYTGYGIYPFVNGNGGGTATFLTGPGGPYTPPETNVLDDGQWHFIAAVYDCPYSSGDKRLYFDGVLVQEASVMGSVSQNSDAAWIGANIQNGGDNFWPGSLSDVALFNRALSATEISNLYAVATTGSSPLGISGQPASRIAFAGLSTTFNVGATGPQPFSYQWRRAGVPIPGASRLSYTIASVSPSDADSYDVVVTDNSGSTNSQAAWLSVIPEGNPAGGITVGLVAHYEFDGNFADSSGNNHNAMAVGAPAFVPGQIGSAIQVNNTSNYNLVVLDNPTNIDNNADFQFNSGDMITIAYWVNYTGTPGDQPMICNVVNSTDNQGFVFADSYFDDGGGNLQLSIEAYPSGEAFSEGDFTADGPTLLNDGNWHHIAVAIDALNNVTRVYIDGGLAVTHPIPNSGNLDYSDGLIVGSDPTFTYQGNAPGGYTIDDMGIWRRLLTAQEVAGIYTAGQSHQPFTAAVPPPVVVVPLTISLSGANIQVSWPQGQLQSAQSLDGPWTAVPGATAPLYSTPQSGGPTFYRVHP